MSLAALLLAASLGAGSGFPRADLERGEAELRAGRAREALGVAEQVLAGPLDAEERLRALELAAAAAAALDDPVRARFYRLARWADEGVPPELLRDQAEERYREVVASAEALFQAPMPAARRHSLILLLVDAHLALGDYREAVAAARRLPRRESGELLLLAAGRLLEAGAAPDAFDAAATAEPPLVEDADEDEPHDRSGFEDARTLLLARAAARLGAWDEALDAAAAALALADQPSERDAALAVVAAARSALDTGRPADCALLARAEAMVAPWR